MLTYPLKPHRLWLSSIQRANYPKAEQKPDMIGFTKINVLTGTIIRNQPKISDDIKALDIESSRIYWEGVMIRKRLYRDKQ